MKSEYYYYFILSIVILAGVLMIAGPHFPNSDVSEQKNKDAFISLTVIGVLIITPFLYWMFKIFKATTWADYKKRPIKLNKTGSFLKLPI